ncbi:MAG: hypothetical protein H0U91_05890 [Rubrobacter sp.]|jgi:hypothetical protein|nr:hypothetical protein [Rubrobacter sp.]MBA3953333.1 hypothetical protein [Rubrobacter sp.]MDQ3376195.1 hypothetical protein [Actinomycetota bacterium]
MMLHRIILVREWDTQVAASGCCGRLGGENSELGEKETFAANRCEMEAMGEVYRALKAELFDEDAEITVVDPRNMVWLIPSLLKDARKRGFGIAETWSHLRRGVSYTAIVVDGKTLFSGRIPPVEDAVRAVREEISSAESEMAAV